VRASSAPLFLVNEAGFMRNESFHLAHSYNFFTILSLLADNSNRPFNQGIGMKMMYGELFLNPESVPCLGRMPNNTCAARENCGIATTTKQ
jgi:hypothetical protein